VSGVGPLRVAFLFLLSDFQGLSGTVFLYI
jgi:hypothetical protein